MSVLLGSPQLDTTYPIALVLSIDLVYPIVLVLPDLLPTGSEEREVLGVGCIPVAILSSCQDMKTIALQCREINIVG